MKMRSEPGVFIGTVVGAMLTAALIAVFYAGWRLADLAFVPFDVFDWMSRILPGAFIEFVIGAMVAAIRGLHLGPTSVVTKLIEQGMGIVGLFITGVVAGAVLFSVLGVACVPELFHGMRLCMGLDIPVVGIPLNANRCMDGRVSSYFSSPTPNDSP